MPPVLADTLLLVGWGSAWYLLFVRFARPSAVPVRASRWFVSSGLVLLFTLGMWGSQAWQASATVAAQPAAVGLALFVSGLLLMVVARRALPLSNYDLVMRVAIAARAAGVYRYVWHPMYVGLLLALVGTSLMLGGGLVLMYMWFVGAALLVRIAAERWG